MFTIAKSLSTEILIISSCFLLAAPVIANTKKTNRSYNPPSSEEIEQKRTVGSGSRSQCSSPFENNTLTLLVPPEEKVHYTTTSNPSLYFYATKSAAIPLKFNLVIPEPINKNPLIETILLIEHPGIYKINLPNNIKLANNQIYLWQIGIPCNNNPENINQVLQAAIERVKLSDQFNNQLKFTHSSLERAKIYANSGIWYDALNYALQKSRDSSKSVTYAQKLGKEIGITLERNQIVRIQSLSR